MCHLANTPGFEWLQLGAEVLTPLVLFCLGIYAKIFADRIEERRGLKDIQNAWRLDVVRNLLPYLNDIYCFFTYQGNWRLMSPDDATAAKRESDRIVFTNRFLFSDEFMEAYETYKRVAFLESQGRGRDFLFRANVDRHMENPEWSEEWRVRFVNSDERVLRKDFVRAYDKMLSVAVRDLGVVGK